MFKFYNDKYFIKKCNDLAKKEIIILSKNKKKKLNYSKYNHIIKNNTFCSKF